MASPNIATILTPKGGKVFPPTSGNWPLLQGEVDDEDTTAANLTVYARLWSVNNRQIWTRQMTYVSGKKWQYQTVAPGTSEVKRWTFPTGITGGSWAITYHDEPTDDIPWGATVEQIADRLANHSDLPPGQIDIVWNGTTRQLTFTFKGDRGGINIDNMGIVNKLKGPGDLTITGTTVTSGTGDFPTTDNGRGHYFWDMVAYDGSRYAGGSTKMNLALAPDRGEFWIDDPLVLTTTFPTANATTTVPGTAVPFRWNVSNIGNVPIERTLINIVNDATDEQVDIDQDGHWESDDPTIREYRLPYQRIVGNDTTWRWNLRVTSASGLSSNLYGTLDLQYPLPPKPTTLTAPLGGQAGVEWADVAWTVTPDAAFKDFVVRVRPVGTSSRGPDDVVVWRSTNSGARSFRLMDFSLNVDQIISVSQRAVRNGEVVESDPKEVTISPKADVILLSEREVPRRTVVVWAHDGRSISPSRSPEYLDILNVADPIVVLSSVGKPRDIGVSMRLRPEGRAAHREDWRAMLDFDNNKRKKSFLYRDAMGERYVVNVDAVSLDHGAGEPAPKVDIQLKTIFSPPISLELEDV